MQSYSIVAAALLGAAALSAASAASAACQLKVTSELHLVMEGNRPLVDGKVNGQPVRFLVDLGATSSSLSPAGAERLGIKAHKMNGVTYYGVGGGEVGGEAIVREVRFGNIVATNVDMLIVGRGMASSRYVGLMGQDLLTRGDIELDFANNVMRIITPAGCSGDDVVYWRKPYSLASLVPEGSNAVLVNVSINGQRATAQLDTGAPTSMVTTGMAERAGVKTASEGVHEDGKASGIAGRAIAQEIATFANVAVGDESISNAKLRMADMFGADVEKQLGSLVATRVVDGPDMLLGADFARAHHIYIARSQGKMYFSYNGGPIFQTVQPQGAAPAAPPAPPAP